MTTTKERLEHVLSLYEKLLIIEDQDEISDIKSEIMSCLLSLVRDQILYNCKLENDIKFLTTELQRYVR